jgi:DNA-binding transcriptional ArsR family regulator
MLVRAGDAGVSVGQLQAALDIAPSTLSHHVKALVIAGLIEQERRSTTLVCRARYDVMRDLLGFLVAECCVGEACASDLPDAAA